MENYQVQKDAKVRILPADEKIIDRLRRITSILLLNTGFTGNPGLLNGKMGITIFYFVLIISCQSQDKSNENKYFNLLEVSKTSSVKLSDLGFADIEYVPLETNEASMISAFDVVFFHDYSSNKLIASTDYYFFKNRNKIFKFRNNGTFVKAIEPVGRGPNEILNISDLDISKKNQNIYVLSSWQNKFSVYSKEGDFLRTFNIPVYVYEFRLIEGRILCFCGNNSGTNENNFVLIDTMGNIIDSYPNRNQFIQKSGFGYPHENLFYTFQDNLFKKEIFSDTIYFFDNITFKPHIVLDAGERLITPKARSEFDMKYLCSNYLVPMNLLEFGDFIYYEYAFKFVIPDDVLIYSFIASKKDKFQAIINSGEGFTNDLDGGPGILPITVKDDNTILSLVDALQLKAHVASDAFKNSIPKYPEKKKELERLANSLKDTDNPVLVLVKLKK